MRKLVVLLLAAVMIMIPLSVDDADAASGKSSIYWDESVYTYTTNGVGSETDSYRSAIIGYEQGNRGSIKITSALEGYPLTEIADNSFSGTFTSAIVPATVKSIGNNAFFACVDLEDVYFLGDLPTLGTNAFPAGVEFHYLDDSVKWTSYMGAKSLMLSGTENGLRYYVVDGEAVVHSYISGSMVTVPSEVNLDGSDYPVTRIGAYSFYGVSAGGISISGGDNINVIEERAFYKCSALRSFDIDVMYINDEAFRECRNFTGNNGKLIIANPVVYLGFESFRMCNSITYVSVTGPLKHFGDGVFRASNSMEELHTLNIEIFGEWSLDNCTKLKKVVFGDGLISIGDNSFVNNPALEMVEFPDTFRSIGNNVFRGCAALKSVSLGNVEIIGNQAFYGCTSLKSVTMPSSLEKIGERAFALCSNLSEVMFEGDLPGMGNQAFTGCSKDLVMRYTQDHADSWRNYTDYPNEVVTDGSDDSGDVLMYVIIALMVAAVAVMSVLVIMRMRK